MHKPIRKELIKIQYSILYFKCKGDEEMLQTNLAIKE